jgi:voltage-gated potassium channel
MVREFRGTLLGLLAALAIGGFLHFITPQPELAGAHPDVLTSIYAAWMALFAQPAFTPPATWYLKITDGIFPLVGFIVIGEGIVRFAMLMTSRRHGEKEWMRVMASTYRDHVVLCGLGHLGYRVLEELLELKMPVVALEKDPQCRFLDLAKASGIPVLVRDMKDDQALIDAGILHARSIIVATNDDLANLEVAMDARRLNPNIRTAMRMFDQQVASKLRDAVKLDFAFSSSALAAPAVAAMTLDASVVAAFDVAGVPHVTVEVVVDPAGRLAGMSVGYLETARRARVLSRTPVNGAPDAPPAPGSVLGKGDTLLVHISVGELPALLVEARP